MRDGDVVTFHDGHRWRNRVVGGAVLPERYGLRQDALRAGLLEARERGVDHVATYASGAPFPDDVGGA